MFSIENNTGYQKLRISSLDEQDEFTTPPAPSLAKKGGVLRVLIVILSSFALAILSFWLGTAYPKDTYDYPVTNCGKTPDEARSAGCQYESMQRAWIPPECYFPEPMEDYDVFRDREWFEDEDRTIPSNITALEVGDTHLAFTRYWHDEHCTYVLRKMALAVALQKPMINSIPANIGHSNHCAHMIATRLVNSYNSTFLDLDKTSTGSLLVFDTCVPLKVGINR
jgi:hypothetical protein